MFFELVLLAVIALCAVILTATLLVTASDMRRVLRRVTLILPEAEEALRQTNRSLTHLRKLLTHANSASQRVEAVVHQACDAASDALERVNAVKDRVMDFLSGHAGNGAGVGPRRRRGG